MMTPRKLLVDTDGGTDDALALALLAACGRAPDSVTTVFGNVGLEQATAFQRLFECGIAALAAA